MIKGSRVAVHKRHDLLFRFSLFLHLTSDTLLYASGAVALAGLGYYFFSGTSAEAKAKGYAKQAEGQARGMANEAEGKVSDGGCVLYDQSLCF